MITVKYEITFCQKFRSNLMPAHQLVGQCSTITPPTVRHYQTADSAALSHRWQCGTITLSLTLTCHSQHRHSPGTDPTPASSAVSRAHLSQVALTKFLSAAAEMANWKIYAITLNQNHFSLMILHSGLVQILAVWKQKRMVPLLKAYFMVKYLYITTLVKFSWPFSLLCDR